MMSILNKYKVTFTDSDYSEHVFWVHANCVSEATRQAMAVQFDESGLNQPVKVEIEHAGYTPPSVEKVSA